ncbi:hypothetical protein Cgig2_029483 [Carnegiea gigantea]|uniref:WAT1-related protein n=1 Tax=Carnegiea gigantea TaxID=171969 RepID=A0A9Q1QKN8_9CARY|nr:hypothetical protein Cgig2_029483 [Carnegiea gigantea]
MGSNSFCEMLTKAKPYLAIISLQFGYSGMYIVTAVCLKHGMNHFILSSRISVVNTDLELNANPQLMHRFSFDTNIRPVLDQNLYYVGLQYTSATFASASINVLPAITFIMATIFRLEKVDIRKLPSQAKVIGTIVTVSGAMVMTIYRGPVINIFGVHAANHGTAASTTAASSGAHWVLGTILVLGSCLGWSAFFILQSFTLKEYPAELSLTAWICLMGSVEGGAVSLAVVRDMKAWALGWDSRLLASVYTGVVCSGIAYYVQGVVNRQRGPVFVTVFSPLCMIITAALGSVILHELLHLGSIIGAVIIVMGLYTVVWGKSKDAPNPKALSNEKGKAQELPIINNISNDNNNDNNDNIKSAEINGTGMSMIKIPMSQEA